MGSLPARCSSRRCSGNTAGSRRLGRHATVVARQTTDPGTRGIELERPTATVGRPAVSLAPEAVIGPVASSPTELKDRDLLIPVEGVSADQLTRQFADQRGASRKHEALDILAPRNTPVRAVEDGTIARLFYSKAGGITVYQFDPTATFCYYYAHLERYADGLREGDRGPAGSDHRFCRHFGQCPQNDASPAFRHFPSHRGQTLVGRHPYRPLRRSPVGFSPALPTFPIAPPVQAYAGEELGSLRYDDG